MGVAFSATSPTAALDGSWAPLVGGVGVLAGLCINLEGGGGLYLGPDMWDIYEPPWVRQQPSGETARAGRACGAHRVHIFLPPPLLCCCGLAWRSLEGGYCHIPNQQPLKAAIVLSSVQGLLSELRN